MLDVDIPLWYFVASDAEGNMANELKTKKLQSVLKYRRVDIAASRRGDAESTTTWLRELCRN